MGIQALKVFLPGDVALEAAEGENLLLPRLLIEVRRRRGWEKLLDQLRQILPDHLGQALEVPVLSHRELALSNTLFEVGQALVALRCPPPGLLQAELRLLVRVHFLSK